MTSNRRQQKDATKEQLMAAGGILGGLGTLLERLSEMAEKGEETAEIRDSADGKTRGVMGFSIRVGLGKEGGFKVERFGNVRQDEKTGKAVVHPVREPMVDVFDEPDHVLVLAEMPGIVMVETHQLRAAQRHSVNDAGMDQAVGKHGVAASDDSRNRSGIRQEPAAKDQRVRISLQPRQPRLQLLVTRQCSSHKARRSGAPAQRLHGPYSRGNHVRMPSQVEVVVG